MSYDLTKSRILQWLGIILIIGVFGGAYWYFQVYGSTVNAPQNDSLTSGLVGLWSFNGDDISGTTAYDRSGSGNNGTLTNGPTVTQGKVGQALNFTPDNSYVTVAENDTLDLQSSLAGTFSAWIYNNGDIASYQNIVEKGYSSPVPYQMYLVDNSLNLGFYSSVSGSVDSGYAISTGKWIHTTVTVIGTTTKFYVDGVLVATKTGQIGGNGVTALIIGSFNVVSDFNGSIDEVRIYNRALATTEVQSLYALGQSDKVNSAVSQPQGTGRLDSGLAGYWKLDENTGTSAGDSSTNGITGTLTNGPTWTTGQIGSAVDLDGTNDYINLSTTHNYTSSDFTISHWVKLDALTTETGGQGPVIVYKGAYQVRGYYSQVSSAGVISFLTNQSGANQTSSTASGTIGTGAWYHVAYARKGSSVRIYVNGIDRTSGVGTHINPADATGENFLIGTYALGGNIEMNGQVDEIRVYNRALSVDEISELYRLTTPTGVDTGLKGYWSFNGKDLSGTTAYDRSGSGNNGTLTGGPTTTEGKLGQALNLDGTDDYVNMGNVSAYNFGTGNFSLSFWMKTGVNPSTNPSYILAKRGICAHGSFWNIALLTSGKISAEVDQDAAGTNYITIGGTKTVTDNQWHQVTVIRSGVSLTSYVDGMLDATGSAAGIANLSNSSNMYVATSQLSGTCSNEYNGILDEVRVYNRALSAAEIKSLYDVGQSDKTNSAVSQPQGTGRLDSGLAGYWKLDENTGTSAGDASTNGNTGTLTNGPTWTTGQIGSAVNFNSSSDYITIPDNSAIDFTSSEDFTLSAWVKSTQAVSAGKYPRIIDKDNNAAGASRYGYNLLFHSDTTAPWQMLLISAGNFYGASGKSDIADGIWHHIVGIRNGSSILTYQDGVLANIGSGTTASFSTTQALRLGADETANINGNFDGSIDEVRIYNRALSADEVSQLYRLTTPTGVDTSLKGYWSFNGQDMSGTTAYDRSGSGKNGTLTNGPTITEGKLGQALSFDGTNDYINLGDMADRVSGTYSFWFKPGINFNAGSTVTQGLFGKYQDNNNNFTVSLRGSDFTQGSGAVVGSAAVGKLLTKIEYMNPTDTAGYIWTSTANWSAGQWYYYAVTWNGSTATTFVNGIQETSGAMTANISVNSGADTIGRSSYDTAQLPSGGPLYFNGSIDEVRVYNRALSADEIKALYNASR